MIFDGQTYTETLDKAAEKVLPCCRHFEDLAEQAGIDKESFLQTAEKYNQMIENGEDTEFGKDVSQLKKIEKPKYYALKIISTTIGTMTGVKINKDTHVIDTEGNIIPNLYAAGEVANGQFYYKEYPASGTSIQMSITLGQIAGTNAAKNALGE